MKTYILLTLLTCTYAAKILVVNPTPSYSHVYFISIIYQELQKLGHDLTVVSPYTTNINSTNLKEIKLHYSWMENMNDNVKLNRYIFFSIMEYHLSWICQVVYSNKDFQTVLKNEKFDLIIIEWYVVPCLSLLKKHFNAPIVGIKSLNLRFEGQDAIGNPTNPSYICLAYNDCNEGFIGRMQEFLFQIYCRIFNNLVTKPLTQYMMNNYFPKMEGNIWEYEKNMDLVITNTHYVINGVKPSVPAVIEVGILHAGKNYQKMPQDMEEFINKNDNIVLMNMGTLVEISPDMFEIIINVFKELPFNVIWKHSTQIENLPENVKIFNWVPQETLLAHHNIKCFITHGGLLSTQEAIHHEVPMLVIPFLFDQPYIASRIEFLGIGRRLHLEEINESNFKDSLNDVATNSSYKKNIQRIRQLVYDQPMQPMEKAIWWIEYVIRNKGAPHIKSKAVDLNWIVYFNLDVIIFIVIIFYIAMFIIKYIIGLIWRRKQKKKRE